MLKKIKNIFRAKSQHRTYSICFFFLMFIVFSVIVFSAMFSNVLCSFFGLVARLHVNICESVM